jgi:hypothetical protein
VTDSVPALQVVPQPQGVAERRVTSFVPLRGQSIDL